MSVLESWKMKCPNCGEDDKIDVVATVWVRLVTDGTDVEGPSCGDHEWGDDSAAKCDACDHEGTVKDFKIPEAQASAA